jgi:hypothetical protein
MKLKLIVLFMMAAVLCATQVQAATIYQWVAESDELWSSAPYWLGPAGTVPDGADHVALIQDGGSLGKCLYTDGMNYSVWKTKVQGSGLGELNISGGKLTTTEDFLVSELGGNGKVTVNGGEAENKNLRIGWHNGSSNASVVIDNGLMTTNIDAIIGEGNGSANSAAGALNINGGTFTSNARMAVGLNGGYGTLTMTGGILNAHNLYVATNADSTGRVYLNGGTINVSSSLFFNTDGAGSGNNIVSSADGVMDITGGKIVLKYDPQQNLGWYADNLENAGLLTAYNGNGEIVSYQDQATGYTVIEAIPEPATIVMLAIGVGFIGTNRKKRF